MYEASDALHFCCVQILQDSSDMLLFGFFFLFNINLHPTVQTNGFQSKISNMYN